MEKLLIPAHRLLNLAEQVSRFFAGDTIKPPDRFGAHAGVTTGALYFFLITKRTSLRTA